MLTLLLVRHAKSSWDDPGQTDFERPLNNRGLKDAPKMAKLIKEKGLTPDLIISSPAERALKTAIFFAEEYHFDIQNIVKQDVIYSGSVQTIFEKMKQIEDRYKTVFVFGHNPNITYIGRVLAFEFTDDFPTCGVLCIDFKTDRWSDISGFNGKMRFFEYPKKDKSN